MELNKTTIEEAIISRVCDQIMDEWSWREQAREALAKRIDAAFKAGVDEVVAAEVDTRRAGMQAALAAQISGRKELSKLVDGYWSQTVDRYGKAATGYDGKMTRAEWHMLQVCGESFSEKMKQEAVNVTAALKDGLRVQLRASTDAMLNDLFRVRSTQDKAEKLF